MNPDDEYAERAEEEIGTLKRACIESGFAAPQREALWAAFGRWVIHPLFAQYPGMLRCMVLNELTFTLSHEELIDEAWGFIGDLVEEWDLSSLGSLKESLRISTFEVFAEAPEVPKYLELLFSLARNPRTRWAVFAAYENVPWRLRPHAQKYSGGSISDDDCDQWLIDQGLGEDEILMKGATRLS